MSSAPPFQVLGTANVASGSNATLMWNSLAPNTTYEWYVTVSDGSSTTTGPTWRFTTAPDNVPPTVEVIAPNGTETLVIGQSATLQWNAADLGGVASVDLLLSRDGSAGTYQPIATGLANTGSYSWIVTGPTSVAAFLEVVAHDPSGNTGQDLSDLSFKITDGIVSVDPKRVRRVELGAMAPNPVVAQGRITFGLPRSAQVRLALVDVQGRELALLASGPYAAGIHEVTWNGWTTHGRARAGLYFVELQADGHRRIQRLLFLP
jgi:hypothetical protein